MASTAAAEAADSCGIGGGIGDGCWDLRRC